ncbi:metallophosphoesterase [Omnitrophica bacterium]|nr:metallophosphoesterase [Candidatus Omnitrophota bacterium]
MSEVALFKYAVMGFCGVAGAWIVFSFARSGKLSKIAKFFLISLLSLAALFVYAFVIEPNWIQVHRVHIQDSKLAEVIGETRIVQITDIHMTEGMGFREKQLVFLVNSLQPDLIMITGDFMDDRSQLPYFKELVAKLDAKLGVFAVPGDTDHLVMPTAALKKELAPAGVDILANESRKLRLMNRNILWLAGSDNPRFNKALLDQTLRGIPAGVPLILLAHQPDMLDEASKRGVNLILAGDTHGGQIGIPGLVKLSDYANQSKYMNGLFEKAGTQMYVNRGIGTKTIPVRFLCRPEIAVIEVEK